MTYPIPNEHSVLVLCEYPSLNGGERSMLSTLGPLSTMGITVAVACPPAGPLAEALHSRGLDVVPFDPFDPGGLRRPLARLREELAAILDGRRPGLLHANSLAMGRLSGPVAAEAGVPSLAHLRDIVRLSVQAAADLNRHVRLLAVSEATRAFHVANGLSAERLHVLYNGVDLDRFRPRPRTGRLHEELGLPPGAAILGTIGQIGLRKGQDVLALAAARFLPQRPEVHLAIVGRRHSEKAESRRFEAALHEAAAALPGRFHFLGVRDDVHALLPEFTLLVHPARQEPLGRVLLEAAAAGVPVVASDVGGTREIFPGETARLVPPGDPALLAAAIEELLDRPGARMALAAAARRRAEKAFTLDRAARGLAEHYRAVRG